MTSSKRYIVSATAPKFTRKGTWDRLIFEQVTAREYGDIDFQNKLVFDVGAHIGSFAYLAASSGARSVHAFEPGLDNYELLKLNTSEFGSTVEPHALAVWNGRTPILGWKPSSDVPNTGGASTHPTVVGLVRVQAQGLDALIEEYGLPEILKLDCEGAEYEIIPDSMHLDQIKLIVGEYHPPRTKSQTLFNDLRARGFRVEVQPTVGDFGHFTLTRLLQSPPVSDGQPVAEPVLAQGG
jgi:FkbM family methyltransferase